MTIIEDTRQQSEKHRLKRRYFAEHHIKVVRSKLPVGDYANLKDLSVIVDTKKDIQEIAANVTGGHRRFTAECDLAAECGIRLIVLIENREGIGSVGELCRWKNERQRWSPKALSGKTLSKILKEMEYRHGVTFDFCRPEDAGKKILEWLSGEE